MKIISKTFKILPLLLFVFVIQACSNDDDNNIVTPPQQLDIVDTAIAASPELTSLVAALQAADGDLVNVLRGNGPFTVLAPTNDAFATFLNGTPLDQVDTSVLQQILLNHVISADLTSTDLVGFGSGYTRTNADGAGNEKVSIYFNTSNGVRFNNVSSVIDGGADINASNGTVHIVDAVIGLPTIVDHALANPGLTDLVGALTAGGNTTFTDLLSTPGDFTVFAPDNTAFGEFTNPNGNDIGNVLSNHVIVGATAISTGLASGYVSTAAVNADDDNLSMYINAEDGVVLNGTTTVTEADIVATNGVIHVVNEVIDLPTIVTHALANTASFSTLVAALTDLTPTDYVSVLSSNDPSSDASPFTVFAPVDAAFGDLLGDLGLGNATEIPTATLEATLNLHVLTDLNVRAEDLAGLDGASVPTFGGPSITIDAATPAIIDPDGGSNPIVVTDVQAINGVIHAVSRVIRDL